MNTRFDFNITLNLYGNVTDAHKNFVAGKILQAVEVEKMNHGIVPDDAEEIEAGAIVSCEPSSAVTYGNCKPSGIVSKYSHLGMMIIEVQSLSVLENIQAHFNVFTQPDDNSEIIMDCTALDGNEESTALLLDILGLKASHELAEQLPAQGFVVFHA